MNINSTLLRRPEADKFYRRPAVDRYDREGLVDIRPPHAPAEILRPVDWKMNPYKDKTWQLYFHSLGWMQIFVSAIDTPLNDPQRLTDPLDDLKAIAMSCVEDVLAREPDMKSARWDDHATAYRCSNLCFFYAHALAPILTEAERADYMHAIALHARILDEFIVSGKWAQSNHLIFHVEGLADAWAVFRDDVPGIEEMFDHAVSAIIGFIDRSIDEEGTTNEHASFYQAFLMGRISETIEFFERLGRPLPVDVAPRMHKAAAFLWNIMPRWGVLPPFGDTQFEKKLAMNHVKRFQQEPWIGPEYRQWHDPDYAGRQPEPLRSYPVNGFHILRDNPVRSETALYSLFLERPFRGPHGHWDGNSFMTYYGGEPFLIDSGGPFKYGDKLRYQYFQTQLAHNSVIFGGTPQKLETTVVASGGEDGLTYVIGRGTFPDGSVWLRIFGHLDGTAVFAVDLARPGEEAAHTPPLALFHVSPKLRVAPDGPGGRAFRTEGGKASAQISFARPGGPEYGVISDTHRSMVTSVDTRYEEGTLLEQPLRSARPLLTLCSFAGETAMGVEVEDGACHLRLGGADSPRTVTVPLPPGLLQELGAPASDAEDAPRTGPVVRDTVTIINLDGDEARWTALRAEIDRIGYAPARLGGVRGLYLPQLVVDALPGASTVERGTLGCFLSHLRAWESIAEGPEACGFVVEDDTAFAPWMPRSLGELVARSGVDWATCNRRIQEDETRPVTDLSDQAPEIRSLGAAVAAKDKEFRAPGGEGYFLTRAGALKLIGMVRAHGIHGDVDWFMLWAALTPEERANVVPGSRLARHFERLSRLYPDTTPLSGGLLTPWMVRHTAPKSSRKRDNEAAAQKTPVAPAPRPARVEPRRFSITGRPRAGVSQSKPGDFKTGAPLPGPVPADLSVAYAADFERRELVLTDMPKEPALQESEHFYVAQRQHAQAVSRVPFDWLERIYPEGETPLRPMLVMSIGRCGLPQVGRLVRAAGLTAISEPETFSQADGLRGVLEVQKGAPKGRPIEDAVRVLRSTVRALSGWADVPPERLVLKLRSQANVAVGPISRALPEARYVFLFRQRDDWIRDFVTSYNQTAVQVASTLFRGIKACAELTRAGRAPQVLWYEDRIADPETALTRILGGEIEMTDHLRAVLQAEAEADAVSRAEPPHKDQAALDARVAQVIAEFEELWKTKRPAQAIEELGLPY